MKHIGVWIKMANETSWMLLMLTATLALCLILEASRFMLIWKFAAIPIPPLKWPIWTITSSTDPTKPSLLRFSLVLTQNVYGRPTLSNKTVPSWIDSWLLSATTIHSTIQLECSQRQTFGQASSVTLAILSEIIILFGMLTTTFTAKWIQVKILTTLYPSEDGLLPQSNRLKETQLLQVCAAMLGMSTWTEFGCPFPFDLPYI